MAFEVKYSKEAEDNIDAITAWLLYERLAGETAESRVIRPELASVRPWRQAGVIATAELPHAPDETKSTVGDQICAGDQ
jgi:hypothetical protein